MYCVPKEAHYRHAAEAPEATFILRLFAKCNERKNINRLHDGAQEGGHLPVSSAMLDEPAEAREAELDAGVEQAVRD